MCPKCGGRVAHAFCRSCGALVPLQSVQHRHPRLHLAPAPSRVRAALSSPDWPTWMDWLALLGFVVLVGAVLLFWP
jgi:hypothetical protein